MWRWVVHVLLALPLLIVLTVLIYYFVLIVLIVLLLLIVLIVLFPGEGASPLPRPHPSCTTILGLHTSRALIHPNYFFLFF